MEMQYTKELLWLHFSPLFLWWKNLYILIFGIKKITFSNGSPYNFSNLYLAENFKNEPNRGQDPLNFLNSKYQNVQIFPP